MTNASSYRLARFYVGLQGENWPEKLGTVVDDYVQCTGITLWEYSLNFERPRRFDRETLIGELSHRPLADFESLSLEEQEGALGLHIGNAFRYLDVSGVYEYAFAFRSKGDFTEQFRRLAESLSRAGEMLYGYGRHLSSDIDPASENRITRSFFGGVRVKGGKPIQEWLEHPGRIREGTIKGIYSLNLISDRRAQQPIAWWGPEELQRASRIGDCLLVQLTDEELVRAKSRKDIGKSVRQDLE